MLELVRPSTRYKTSYLKALGETRAEQPFVDYQIAELRRNFQAHVDAECAIVHPQNISIFRVPETIFWLVDNDEYIGRLELRHRLQQPDGDIGGHIGYSIRLGKRRNGYGYKILKLGIQKAAERSMNRVWLTCDPDNIASRKIIERNGGHFQRRIDARIDGAEYHKLGFWIEVSSLLRRA